jgi:hypothetical protein
MSTKVKVHSNGQGRLHLHFILLYVPPHCHYHYRIDILNRCGMWNSTIVAIRIMNDNKMRGIGTIDRKDHQPSGAMCNVQCTVYYLLSANLDLVLEPRLTADVSWYEGVSKLYVGKQGCEFSLSQWHPVRSSQGREVLATRLVLSLRYFRLNWVLGWQWSKRTLNTLEKLWTYEHPIGSLCLSRRHFTLLNHILKTSHNVAQLIDRCQIPGN